jgi:hypothetical protein
MTLKKIKGVEVAIFACLLALTVLSPRWLVISFAPKVPVVHELHLTADEIKKNAEWEKAFEARYPKNKDGTMTIPAEAAYEWPPYHEFFTEYVDPAPGSWLEWVIRIALAGLTLLYTFRIAKRIHRQSLLPTGENKGS